MFTRFFTDECGELTNPVSQEAIGRLLCFSGTDWKVIGVLG